MKQEKSCGAIVMNENKEILLVHHNSGHWDFPKGHMEKGETEEQTAIREVKEETNIDILIEKNYRYTTSYSPKDGVMKEVVYFLAKNIDNNQKPQIEEVSEVKWFEFNEAIEQITFNNSKIILNKLKEDLKGGIEKC